MKISSLVVRRLLEAFDDDGSRRGELLCAAGITADMLDGPAIAGGHVERLCEAAVDRSADPAIALRWASRMSPRTFAPVSHTVMHTPSLRQALALLDRFGHLFCDQRIFELDEDGEVATLRFLPWRFRSARMRRFEAEVCLAGFASMITDYHPGARLRRVRFTHRRPEYHANYTRLFGPVVQFDAPFDGLTFDRALLDRRNPDSDDELRGALTRVLERRLVRASNDASYAMRVRDLLAHALPVRLDMEAAARKLGLAERSLRRRLVGEGVTFRKIQSEACAAYAERLLVHDRFTIQEASHQMGFSDPSAFHRAFKRWTGHTPQAVRGS